MKIVVIDAQGGGIGKGIIELLRETLPTIEIIAVGTNVIATNQMLKAGASVGATGENAVIYNVKQADIVAGPIGIAFANSMYGEITPLMAQAIGECNADKVLVPISKSNVKVVGVTQRTMSYYLSECVKVIREIVDERGAK